MLALRLQTMLFFVGINDSEPDINSEVRGKKFWIIQRNNIDAGINELEMRNLKSSELGDISMKWRLFSAHYSPYYDTKFK